MYVALCITDKKNDERAVISCHNTKGGILLRLYKMWIYWTIYKMFMPKKPPIFNFVLVINNDVLQWLSNMKVQKINGINDLC